MIFLYIGRRIREHETVKLKELNARKKTLLVNPRLINVYFYTRTWAGDLNVDIYNINEANNIRVRIVRSKS